MWCVCVYTSERNLEEIYLAIYLCTGAMLLFDFQLFVVVIIFNSSNF